jgi:hypothetical protein
MPTEELQLIEEERFLASTISSGLRGLNPNGTITSMIGMTLLEKAKLIPKIDQHVAPIGSGAELYSWIFKVPGIYFGPTRMLKLAQSHQSGIVEDLPPCEFIGPAREWGEVGCESYEIDPSLLQQSLRKTSFFRRLQ